MYKELHLDKILFYKRNNRFELFYEKYGEPVYFQLSKGYLSKKIENSTKYIWLGYFSNTLEKNKTFTYLTKLKNCIENTCNIKLETFFYDNGICIPCQNSKGNLQLEIYVRQNEILSEDNLNNFPEKSFIIPMIYIENIVFINDKWRINIKLVQICVFPLYQKFGKCVIEFDNNVYPEFNNAKISKIEGLPNRINVKISEHPTYSKYFKMCKMGIPKAAVIIKMNNEITNIDAESILNRDPNEQETIELIMVEEHENYMKFFKMVKMGIPKEAIEHKMILEKIDTDYLLRGKELIPNIKISNCKDIFSDLMLIKLKKNKKHDFKLDRKTNEIQYNNLSKKINVTPLNNNGPFTICIEEIVKKRNTLLQNQKNIILN